MAKNGPTKAVDEIKKRISEVIEVFNIKTHIKFINDVLRISRY